MMEEDRAEKDYVTFPSFLIHIATRFLTPRNVFSFHLYNGLACSTHTLDQEQKVSGPFPLHCLGGECFPSELHSLLLLARQLQGNTINWV